MRSPSGCLVNPIITNVNRFVKAKSENTQEENAQMIHAKQFIISKKQYNGPDFLHIQLSDGYTLSCHKDLEVFCLERSSILLLGIAWQADPLRPAPAVEMEELAEKYDGAIPEERILRMEESWCGRYVLIVQGRVYLDASGLLGIFYSKTGISSSCSLLADSMGLPQQFYTSSPDMNWLPAPLTPFEQIKRLLPSQTYDYYKQTPLPRQLLAAHAPVCSSEEDRIRTFTDFFTSSLQNMVKTLPGKKILIPLTGGYDSRTLLALAKHAGIEFECVTLEHGTISIGDRDIPSKICQALDIPYIYVHRQPVKYSEGLIDEYRLHTSGLADDGDKLHYAHGQYQELIDRFGDVIFLRGSLWEVAVEHFQKFIGDTFDSESILDNCGADNNPLIRRSLEEYLNWVSENKQNGLNACNLFYWDQREGSWLSSIEQSFDLMDRTLSLQPLNCRLLITLLLGFPKQERMIKQHQVKIISYACPPLAHMEFGSPRKVGQSSLQLFQEKFERGCSRLRTMGLRKTFKTYRHIISVNFKITKLQHKAKR